MEEDLMIGIDGFVDITMDGDVAMDNDVGDNQDSAYLDAVDGGVEYLDIEYLDSEQ